VTDQTATTEAIRRSVTVDASQEHAFRFFTERMGDWWPLKRYSVHENDADEAGMEPRLGGAVFERWSGGTEYWGEILVWEPPRRVAFTWHPGSDPAAATEVEVVFTEEGERTRVDLEHRGWERLGERAPEVRAGYAEGWQAVLDRYSEAAAAGH
jgi:uncharacterized protein YndB with AHSA1/START domain